MKLKVISLNIWWGGNLFAEIVDFLKTEDADIVALQEVYNDQSPVLADKYRSMERLRQQLPAYLHTDFAEAYQETIPKGKVPHGNAVFCKFPIVSKSLHFMAEPQPADFEYRDIPEHWPLFPAPLQHVELETPAGAVNVFNMHGVWDLDGDSYSQRRQRMSEVILAATKNKPNVILLGDSNAKASNQAMRNLETQLKPVFGDDLTTTFNMHHKTNPGYATAAVDVMYVSQEIDVVAADCPDVDISDHLPLIAALHIA